jgi:predicted GNAT superfamily acetyltransferase
MPHRSGSGRFVVRDACSGDVDAMLALNSEWEHVTSPLTREELVRLFGLAAECLVAADGESVAAFLLAFGPGVDYRSPNYLWFDRSADDFFYVDRVVVSSAAQRMGLGDALYDEAFGRARDRGASRVVCEVDIDPPNPASDAFHRKRGFVEVGTQPVADGAKTVSLRECRLDAG